MNFNSMDIYFQEPQFPENTLQLINNNKQNDNTIDINKYEITKHLYQNTRGFNTPNSYMVVLDSQVISSATRENNFLYNKVVFDLVEPIIIDSPTDIYLEFLHFKNTDVSDSNGSVIVDHLEKTSQFYINIDEFSIKNITNNQFQSSKFFIPNEIYGKSDSNKNDDDTNVQVTYTRLKAYYLCRIEANYIKRLTLTIRADGSSDTTYGYLSNIQGTSTSSTSITDQSSLIAWATDSNATGQLQNDITLSGGSWPLALNNNKILDGNGYTITLHSGITSGLFQLTTNNYSATVKNIIINANAITTMSTDQGVLFGTGNDSDNLTITVTDVGIIGTFSLGSGGGSIFGKFDGNTGCHLNIKNCFSSATISGIHSGGLIGDSGCNGGGSIKIHNCFTTGNITGQGAGGIVGNSFGTGNSTSGHAIITNSYSFGNIVDNDAGGIVGSNVGDSATENILVGNCYSFGNISGSGGGIIGSDAYGNNLIVEHCHSKHATGVNVGNNKFVKSLQSGHLFMWSQIGSDFQGLTNGDEYGIKTAISGDGTVVAFSAHFGDGGGSDSGEVSIYQYNGVALGSVINGDAGGQSSAIKLNNDGTRIIIGERWNPNDQQFSEGTAKIYEYSGGTWSQIGQDIVGEGEDNNGSQLGVDVSINGAGDRIIVGARYWDKLDSNHTGSNYGFIEVYDLVADGGNGGTGTWTLVGSRIEGAFRSQYGTSVDINSSGNRIIVGAPFGDINPLDGQANRTDPRNTTNEGTFYVYEYNSGTSSWDQLGSQIWGVGDKLGFSVAINNSGDKIVVSPRTNNYWNAYEYNSGTSSWDLLGIQKTTTSSEQIQVDINGDGDIVVVGDKKANSNKGEVNVYKYISNDWVLVSSTIPGQNAGDNFGAWVDISDQGDYITIGAPLNDDAGTNRGEGYVYHNPLLSSGGDLGSAGSGTWTPNLGTTLKDNYTDSQNVLTDSNVWTTTGGTFANGYGLTVFSDSPWENYTTNSSLPTMINAFNDDIIGNGSVKIGLFFDKTRK